jgi:hypothetical protein
MLKSFIFRLFLFSLALYGIMFVIFYRVLKISIPAELMLGLLFILNAGAYLIMIRTKTKRPASFVSSYMITTVSRLLICGAFIFIYALSHKEIARMFALTFFVLYILYIIVEVRELKRFFKA